jgi:hypothetical protein
LTIAPVRDVDISSGVGPSACTLRGDHKVFADESDSSSEEDGAIERGDL